MPSGVPADLGAGASLGDLSVGDAGLVALRFAGFFACLLYTSTGECHMLRKPEALVHKQRLMGFQVVDAL